MPEYPELAIDARVVGFRITADGEHKLTLEGRLPGERPGQGTLVIENPPPDVQELEAFVGVELWGGSGFLVCGDKEIADRTSYVGIRLRPAWRQILAAHKMMRPTE